MKKYSVSIILLLLVLSLSACNVKTIAGVCPDAEISWVDVLKINDIKYEGGDEGLFTINTVEKGKKIGEVDYMLADHACSNHRMKNGDAAFLPIGTEIYELVGYKSDFRVVADNKVYQVSENKKAKSMAELLDIKGKVAKMSLESDYDGSHLLDFTEQETIAFVKDLRSLEYVGAEEVYKIIESDNRAFLRIHLLDGSSFRMVYWLDENAFHLGAFGTKNMKEIVESKLH